MCGLSHASTSHVHARTHVHATHARAGPVPGEFEAVEAVDLRMSGEYGHGVYCSIFASDLAQKVRHIPQELWQLLLQRGAPRSAFVLCAAMCVPLLLLGAGFVAGVPDGGGEAAVADLPGGARQQRADGPNGGSEGHSRRPAAGRGGHARADCPPAKRFWRVTVTLSSCVGVTLDVACSAATAYRGAPRRHSGGGRAASAIRLGHGLGGTARPMLCFFDRLVNQKPA